MIMKIAFLAPEFLPTWGGVGIYSVNLVKELSKDKKLKIHVITPDRGYPKKRVLEYFENNITLHYVSKADDTFFYNLKYQLAVRKSMPVLHKKHKFDILHSANLVQMPDIFLKNLGIPVVCTVHTTIDSQILGRSFLSVLNGEPVEKLSRVAYPYIKFLQARYLKSARHFIAVSSYIKNQIPGNARVVHNGIDTNNFCPGAGTDYLKRMKQPKVLFTGRLLHMKGIPVIAQIIKQTIKSHNVFFVLAGSGDISKWKRFLKGVPSRYYKFTGYIEYEKINELYRSCDIFILPSLTESLPLSVLEAMSSGLPVIASRVGGIPEIITHKENGFLVEPQDAAGFVKHIKRLAQDPGLRRKIGDIARKHICENFTMQRMGRETRHFYETIKNENLNYH
jgi:glycosyltransferase involved in cell wall biosynthesis